MQNDKINRRWPEPLSGPEYAELREAILSVNKERTLAYFEQMQEKSRVKFAPAVRAWDESLTPSPSSSKLAELGFRAGQPSGELDRLAQIFVLSACEFKDISKSLRTSGALFKSEDVERILRFRRPKWIMPLSLDAFGLAAKSRSGHCRRARHSFGLFGFAEKNRHRFSSRPGTNWQAGNVDSFDYCFGVAFGPCDEKPAPQYLGDRCHDCGHFGRSTFSGYCGKISKRIM